MNICRENKVSNKVFCELGDITDKYEAFRFIIDSCEIFSQIDREVLISKVVEREHLQTTGMGHGVAIAHGKMEGIGKPFVAFGYSKKGLEYDNVFPEPVHLLFVIASDIDEQNEYIRAVSSILSWVHDMDFRNGLLSDYEGFACRDFITMLSERNFHPLWRE